LVIWQNSQATTLSLLSFSSELPLMVWLGRFLIIGSLLGIALMSAYRRRQDQAIAVRPGRAGIFSNCSRRMQICPVKW
jgi:uncharacterized integral membrane protein